MLITQFKQSVILEIYLVQIPFPSNTTKCNVEPFAGYIFRDLQLAAHQSSEFGYYVKNSDFNFILLSELNTNNVYVMLFCTSV